MQKVRTKDSLIHISNDERPLEAFFTKFKWKATCAMCFNFLPIGCHQWGRVSKENCCTVISRRNQNVRNLCTCVNEERAALH